MVGRARPFSDERVQSLLQGFVPVAEESHHLKTVPGIEGDLFRKIAHQGHYGHLPLESTRQGIYAALPDGTLLASTNCYEAADVAKVLEVALSRWNAMPSETRSPSGTHGSPPRYLRPDAELPADGTALQVFSRDLVRPQGPSGGSWAFAWNMDSLWLTADDVRSFFPRRRSAGAAAEADPRIARRLARFHLVDNVRGQVWQFLRENVRYARLHAETSSLQDRRVRLTLRGVFHAVRSGVWSTEEGRPETPQEFGYAGTLLGRAEGDLGAGRVDTFEAVALGTRWGSTGCNIRNDDKDPSSVGHALVLTSDPVARKVSPAAVQSFYPDLDYWEA